MNDEVTRLRKLNLELCKGLMETIVQLNNELENYKFKIPFELTPDKGLMLTLTLSECEALTKCPFLNNHASENNYPGYNEVIDKIFDFVDDNRKS
jgi:hypothetical protein